MAQYSWGAVGLVAWRFLTSYSTPIVACYLLMVFTARYLMKLFSPLRLHTSLIVHNVICCAGSFAVMAVLVPCIWIEGSIFTSWSEVPYVKTGIFIYWMTKYYELLDTVFMLLRHKGRQMSFLHVFHHASMTFFADYSFNFAPFINIAFGLCLNSFVHVVMYGYYALTAIYPLHEFTWKKRITQLQMAQFAIGLVQCTYGYLYHRICIYSIFYVLTLMLLFSNFYYRTFILRKDRKSK